MLIRIRLTGFEAELADHVLIAGMDHCGVAQPFVGQQLDHPMTGGAPLLFHVEAEHRAEFFTGVGVAVGDGGLLGHQHAGAGGTLKPASWLRWSAVLPTTFGLMVPFGRSSRAAILAASSSFMK